jgi:hypothetical protein
MNPDRIDPDHPEVNADLADLQRLRDLYQSACPPAPDEAAWAAVLSRIHGGVPSAPRRASRPIWAILGTVAAAALLAVLLARSWWAGGPRPQLDQGEAPYPVVEASDVAIVSMDAGDVAALVVGEPPVGGEVEFVRPEDVRVLKCQRCPFSGNMARLEPGEVPMFVTTVAQVDGDNDE